MKRYADIRNIRELDEAKALLSKRIKDKEEEVSERIYLLRDDYSPENLFSMALRDYSDRTGKPVAFTVLGIVRGLIRLIKKTIDK
jgi:hypothetical protein